MEMECPKILPEYDVVKCIVAMEDEDDGGGEMTAIPKISAQLSGRGGGR